VWREAAQRVASFGDATEGRDVPRRKRRNNPTRDQEWGPQQGGASLHLGGLTSQQTRHGWQRGKKNQIARAPAGRSRPSGLESPQARRAWRYPRSMTSLRLWVAVAVSGCGCLSSVVVWSLQLRCRLRCHCMLAVYADQLSWVELKSQGPDPGLIETFFYHLRTLEV